MAAAGVTVCVRVCVRARARGAHTALHLSVVVPVAGEASFVFGRVTRGFVVVVRTHHSCPPFPFCSLYHHILGHTAFLVQTCRVRFVQHQDDGVFCLWAWRQPCMVVATATAWWLL